MNWTLPRFFFSILLLSLFPATVVGTDVLRMDFGGGWEFGYEHEEPGYFILEYVPTGQTIDNWSHLLTFQGFAVHTKPHRITLRNKVERLEKRMRTRCKNTIWKVLWEKEDRVIYEWRVFRCPEVESQAEIAAFIAGNSTLFRTAYTLKTKNGMGRGDRNWWERVFLDAEVIQED
ncbi:MAG: hypothetical protein U9P00_03670 [Pseudomonadota bacterium]|nr:hypothetical protein [Pseudomonadota bacterium]